MTLFLFVILLYNIYKIGGYIMDDFKKGFKFGLGFHFARFFFLILSLVIIAIFMFIMESNANKNGRTILPWKYKSVNSSIQIR